MSIGSRYNMEQLDDYKDGGLRFIIWDDLVHSGSTLIECAKALKALYGERAATIQAFVTHAIFENDAHLRFLEGDMFISRFYVTNSIPEVAAKLEQFPEIFSVLDVMDAIAPFLVARILPDVRRTKANAKGICVPFVSSESHVKTSAVERGLSKAGYRILSPKGIPCASGVSPQPFGEQETLDGLYARHTELREHVFADDEVPFLPEKIYLISIENGLIPDSDGVLHDTAFILLEKTEKGTGKHALMENAVVCGHVPDEHRDNYLDARKANPELTFGEYLVQNIDPSVDHRDWSKTHGGSECTRLETICNSIASLAIRC